MGCEELLRYIWAFGGVAAVFMVAMLFVDACVETYRDFRQKQLHRDGLPCYTKTGRDKMTGPRGLQRRKDEGYGSEPYITGRGR